MRLFRSTWLQRSLLFLLLFLLNTGHFGSIEQQGDGKDELVIHAAQYPTELSSLRQLQIKYGFDVIHVSVVPIFKKIISADHIPGTSYDPLSADLLTYPSRAPPRLISIL
jgi:hypothetical protein